MKFIGIIPARYASTRFPGKPLAEICGKTVIRRVYEQACKALDTVVVATDDDRIYEAVETFGGKVVMTRPDHKCGTDRCLEAYQAITTPAWREQNDKDTVIINIQGDEPFIQPEQIEALMACFDRPDTDIATLVQPFAEDKNAIENPNSPKVNWDIETQEAKMFSRKVIAASDGKYYKHAKSLGDRRAAGTTSMARKRLQDPCRRDHTIHHRHRHSRRPQESYRVVQI